MVMYSQGFRPRRSRYSHMNGQRKNCMPRFVLTIVLIFLGFSSIASHAAETFAQKADRAILLSDVSSIKGMKVDERIRRDDEDGSRRGFRDGRKTTIGWTVGENYFSAKESHRQFLADSDGFFGKREILEKDAGLGQKSVLYQTILGDHVTGLTYLIWYDEIEIKVHLNRRAKPWADHKAYRKFHAKISSRAARRLKPPCHSGNFADIPSWKVNKSTIKPAKKLLERMCKLNIIFSWSVTDPYTDIADYVTDADGQYKLVRSGYEVALYKRIKYRLFNPDKFSAKLSQSSVFWEAVIAIVDTERTRKPEGKIVVRLWDAFLTAHNVVRILARPEQWSGANWPITETGQNRKKQDRAIRMLLDLKGEISVDDNPPFYQQFGSEAFRKHGDKAYDPALIYRQMFRSGGPFGFYTAAEGAEKVGDSYGKEHWNGGIHYYFWVGVIVNFTGTSALANNIGRIANIGASMYERVQKSLGGEGLRGAVQTNHGHDAGGKWASAFFAQLAHVELLDPSYVVQ